MFNFRKKAQQLNQEIKRAFEPAKDSNTLIAEIHEEFDSSTERLLNEAKGILAKSTNTDKGEALRKLGFTNSKPSVEAALDIKIKKEKQELAENIQYFQQWYPNNKYITEAEVEKICKKYGLLCGEAQYYIGDVPDKNVQEMACFKLREKDCIVHELGWFKRENSIAGYSFFMSCLPGEGQYGWIQEGSRFMGMLNIESDTTKKHHYERPSFKICATVKDFDTNNMRIDKGYRLEQNLPDPIVLQPVKGGYLIVSKWGLPEEANNELINEKLN